MTAAGQPTCASCGALLPWDDVDRGSGQCRQCGASFTFDAVPIVADAAMQGISSVWDHVPAMTAIMEPIKVQPSGIQLTRRGGAPAAAASYRESGRATSSFELRYRGLGQGGMMLAVFTLAWCLLIGLVIQAAGPDAAKWAFMHILIAVFLVWLTLRQFKNRLVLAVDETNIAATQLTESGERTERVATADVVRVFCQHEEMFLGTAPATKNGPARPMRQTVHHVCVRLASGQDMRLLSEIEKRDVAFWIAQLLSRELAVPTM